MLLYRLLLADFQFIIIRAIQHTAQPAQLSDIVT